MTRILASSGCWAMHSSSEVHGGCGPRQPMMNRATEIVAAALSKRALCFFALCIDTPDWETRVLARLQQAVQVPSEGSGSGQPSATWDDSPAARILGTAALE